VATPEQLVEWLTRMMISAVLFPATDPDDMARGLTAVYGLLSAAPPAARPRKTTARKPKGRTR